MTAGTAGFHRRYHAGQLLIEGRRKMIRECCLFSPLGLNPDFYGHSGNDYAGISYGGTKLEINIESGFWGATNSCSNHLESVGAITGTRENFLLVLEKVFPRKNMCGT